MSFFKFVLLSNKTFIFNLCLHSNQQNFISEQTNRRFSTGAPAPTTIGTDKPVN